MRRLLVVISAALTLAGCQMADRPDVMRLSSANAAYLPAMRWNSARQPAEAEAWTRAVLTALETHGAVLPLMVPADIGDWCPGYADAPLSDRRAFWAGLFSALAKHESTWNPAAVGGGGKWFGLVQISPATARAYGCRAGTGEALKAGGDNLSCAVRIAARTVARDGVVAAGMRGIAADWGPFHSTRKREDMRAWTARQGYCAPS